MRHAVPSRLVLPFALFLAAAAHGQAADQTDWSAGAGVPGPVPDWGAAFDASDGVSWRSVPGQVALSSMAVAGPTSFPVATTRLAFAVHATDVDGDGDMDVVGTSEGDDAVYWWRNDGGDPPVWVEHAIDTALPDANALMTADLDLDGCVDVVATAVGTANDLVWYRNEGGDPLTWTKHVVDPAWDSCFEVAVTDVNLDGRPDVLAGSWSSQTVAWWENGAGMVWTKHVVDASFDGAHCVKAGDLDGDGDVDVVAVAGKADEVAWWRNDGGVPTVWTKHVIRAGFTGGRSVEVADLDDDGDLDVAATCWTSHLSVFKNEGGDPVTWTEEILADNFTGGHHVRVADLSGDGLLDVLAAAFMLNDVVWFENGGGTPTVWTKQVVSAGFPGPTEVDAADVDGDGDLDVLAAAWSVAGRWWWWEATEFTSFGDLESSILDTGTGLPRAKLDWDATVPVGAEVRFQVRSSDDAADLGAWSADFTAPGIAGDLDRFVQVRAFLSTTDAAVTPVVREFSVSTPSVTYRNGAGSNPAVFSSTALPLLGTGWTAEVDGGVLGATGRSLVVGYASPLTPGLALGVGELLIDPTSAWLFTDAVNLAAGVGNHVVAVPNDVALVGFPLATQAFLDDVGGNGQLTNAIDLVLGW